MLLLTKNFVVNCLIHTAVFKRMVKYNIGKYSSKKRKGKKMKALFPVLLLLFFYSCNSVDSNSGNGFSIQTEKQFYSVDSTTSISTIFTNNLGREVKIYNSSCGCPIYTLEKYNGINWVLFRELPMCERLPAKPISLNDGEHIQINVNIRLMINLDIGFCRMKFDIKNGVDNTMIENKYLYSNQFSFIQ